MENYMDDKDKDHHSFTQEEWCDLLSTTDTKDNQKRDAAQINRLAASKTAPYDFIAM